MRIEEENIVDIKLTRRLRENGQELFDIDFDENGDFVLETGFDMALQRSLLGERRASAAEQVIPERRRGWIGNEASDVQGFEMGSKLWLLFQSRLTQTEVNAAVDYANQALEWMVEDNLLKSIDIVGSKEGETLLLNIILFRFNDRVDSRLFRIWNNTGTLEIAN